MLSLRQRGILELLKDRGMLTVNEVAEYFKVTPQSVRKDFERMSQLQVLERTHGRAVLKTGTLNLPYRARANISRAGKQAIARIVAELVPDNATLFLNIGTTTEEVARCLLKHRNLLVVTNNLNVVNILRENECISIICSNGIVRHEDGGIVGEQASQFMSQFKVDFAVIGTSSIDSDGRFLDFDFREVSVTKNLIQAARQVVLVSDSTKFERNAPVIVGSLEDIDYLVTDAPPPQNIKEVAEKLSVKVLFPDVDEPSNVTHAKTRKHRKKTSGRNTPASGLF